MALIDYKRLKAIAKARKQGNDDLRPEALDRLMTHAIAQHPNGLVPTKMLITAFNVGHACGVAEMLKNLEEYNRKSAPRNSRT